MSSKKTLFCLLCFVLCIAAEQTNSKEVQVSASSTYKTAAVLTALTTIAGGLVALAAWIIPIIAYKFCYLFGSCEYGLGAYVDQYLFARQYPLQKRSTDYLGPLLQTLANAYELYEGGDPQKKNSKKATS